MTPNEICLNDGTPLEAVTDVSEVFVCPLCKVAFPRSYLIARRESTLDVPSRGEDER